jgi:hypothetical protein
MAEQKKLLLVDSRNRVSGTIENATYVLDRPIENFLCLRVNYVQIYNTFLNVTTKNNEWAVTDGTMIYIRTLTPGHYTGESLAANINTELQGLDPSLSVSFDSTTTNINWVLAPYSLVQGTSSDRLLGVNGLTTVTGAFSSTPNLTEPNTVMFTSPELQGNDQMYYTNNDSKHLFPFVNVPIFAQFGSSNYYQSNYPIVVHTQSNCLQKFTIRLLDGEGNQIENAIDYQISLVLY